MHKQKSPQIYETITDRTEERNSSTIIVGDFNTLLSIMDKTSRQMINKEIEDLNNSITQIHLTDIQNTPSNNSRIHILLKCTWNILQDRPYIRLQNKPR